MVLRDLLAKEAETVDKGLPESTVLASEANKSLCTIFSVLCEHASTVQMNTGTRALPEIKCETESSQGACGAVKYLLCITLTSVRRTILLLRSRVKVCFMSETASLQIGE